MDELLKGVSRKIWLRDLDNELVRLANGLPKDVTGKNTIGFI